MTRHHNNRHIIINSNRWFSAVTDYSLQLARFLSDTDLWICYPKENPISKHTHNIRHRLLLLPLLKMYKPNEFFKILGRLWILLSIKKSKTIVWVFEGREHTLCAILKAVFKRRFAHIRLVRVRGQTAPLKSNLFQKLLYQNYTDHIVFASQILLDKAEFDIRADKRSVQLYCTDFGKTVDQMRLLPPSYSVSSEFAAVDFLLPTFLVVGRFDPVKGHKNLITALHKLELPKASQHNKPLQLIFIGESKNIQAIELFSFAKELFGRGLMEGNRYFISNPSSSKRIFILDEHVTQLKEWMRYAHFGIIPSLGSEAICRVAVEFLQCGTPILASKVGTLPEVLSGIDAPWGNCISPHVPEDWTQGLHWAYTQALSPQDMFRNRQAARNIGLERFSLQGYQKLVDAIEDC